MAAASRRRRDRRAAERNSVSPPACSAINPGGHQRQVEPGHRDRQAGGGEAGVAVHQRHPEAGGRRAEHHGGRWTTNSAAGHSLRGSRSWKKRMRTCARDRPATIQPVAASHAIRKREPSSVQIKRLAQRAGDHPRHHARTSSDNEQHAGERPSKSRTGRSRRNTGRSGRRELIPQALAPLALRTCAGTTRAPACGSFRRPGLITVMPPLAKVSARPDSCRTISSSCSVACLASAALSSVLLLGVEALPGPLVHHDRAAAS